MESKIIGRPRKYGTPEDANEAKIKYNNHYNLNTSWYCSVCLNNKDYKVAGKHNHLNTQLHQRNVNITKDFLKLGNEIIELKNEIEFLKPKTANETTADFLEMKTHYIL